MALSALSVRYVIFVLCVSMFNRVDKKVLKQNSEVELKSRTRKNVLYNTVILI